MKQATDKQIADLISDLSAKRGIIVEAFPDPMNRPAPILLPIEALELDVVYMMAVELQQLRAVIDGVPPDFQEQLHILDDHDPGEIHTIERAKHELQRRGAAHVRVNRVFEEGKRPRYFMDGWKERPVREAAFKVLKRNNGSTHYDAWRGSAS